MGNKKNTVGMETAQFQEDAKFNLSGLYQALRLTVASGNNTLWVPFDDAGMCCCIRADLKQPMYIEAIYCLLIKTEDLNEGFRIDPATASRITKNYSGLPKYILDYLYKEDAFCVFEKNVKERLLTRFSNEQKEFFRQALIILVHKIPQSSDLASLANVLPPQYLPGDEVSNQLYFSRIACIMFEALKQSNVKSDPVALPALRYKPKDIERDDPYGMATMHSNSTALVIEMIDDKHASTSEELHSIDRALEFIEKKNAFILRIDCSIGRIKVFYKINADYVLRRLEKADYIRASDFLRAHLDEFRPKASWRNRSLSEMVLNGLETEVWTGYIYENKSRNLVSYIDVKIRSDGFCEIGAQLTEKPERGKHFATALINYIRLKYAYARLYTGTFEENTPMRTTLKATGFEECYFVDYANGKRTNRIQERINPLAPDDKDKMTYSVYYTVPSVISETIDGFERTSVHQ